MCSHRELITVEEYYIVFVNATHGGFFLKRLRKGFQHVFAVKLSPGGKFWIIINPLSAYTYTDILSVREYPGIDTLLYDPESTVVKYTVEIFERNRHRLSIITCVEIIKSLLGIQAAWVLTPWQLYQYLTGGHYGRQNE